MCVLTVDRGKSGRNEILPIMLLLSSSHLCSILYKYLPNTRHMRSILWRSGYDYGFDWPVLCTLFLNIIHYLLWERGLLFSWTTGEANFIHASIQPNTPNRSPPRMVPGTHPHLLAHLLGPYWAVWEQWLVAWLARDWLQQLLQWQLPCKHSTSICI